MKRSVKNSDLKSIGFKPNEHTREVNFQVGADGTTEKKSAWITLVRCSPGQKDVILGKAELVLTDYMSETTHKDVLKIPSANEKNAHTIELKFSICLMLANETHRLLLENSMAKIKYQRE